MSKTYVLYHGGGCVDGFTASWASWKRLGDTATYIPCTYNRRPKPLCDLPDGSDVYILDYSFARADLEAAHARMNLLRVVDHHVSAQRDLEGLDYCHFDSTKSGAYLAWEAFHPGVEVPRFVKLVSDRDLWIFDDPDTILLHAALTSFPMNDFKLWSDLADDLEITLLEGRILLRQSKIQIKSICDKATMATFNIGFNAYKVVVCNATSHWSDVGNDLLLAYPDAEFAAVFSTIYDRDTNKFVNKWSLRSRKDGVDVSKIAALFGGGGHEPAAGFSAALDLMPKPIASTKPRQRDQAAK